MIKIKIYELEKHRNETTFRPLLFIKDLFRDIGIEFVSSGKADFAFVGQASFLNKKLNLNESVQCGLDFLQKIEEPYFLFDGQDSTSLIGSFEVFKNSKALYLLKNNLLKDRSLYQIGSVNGRHFWGKGDYLCENFQEYSNKVLLTGFNWLNTFGYNIEICPLNKNRKIDVCSLIGISKENFEHGIRTDEHYNLPRYKIFDQVSKLKCNVITTEKTGKLNREEYFNKLLNSKICISPYGYGEIAIRDIEAISAGCIIIKPDMSCVDTHPNVYSDETYIRCNYDYSDLNEKVDFILSNYSELYDKIHYNLKNKCREVFNPNLVIEHYHSLFLKLSNVTI